MLYGKIDDAEWCTYTGLDFYNLPAEKSCEHK